MVMGDSRDRRKLTYASSIDELCNVNKSFDRGILKVAYTGPNRNGSSISKAAFERSLHTIYNCPVVCNYDRDADEIGSHDVDVVMDGGTPRFVNLTTPVGVIPESARTYWQTFEDEAGVHEYLCVDALLWKRQEAYQKIKADSVTAESMEIAINKGHMDEGVYVIEDFEFQAFCLLGTASPCFEGASLEMFSLASFQEQYTAMMEDFKLCFSQVNSTSAEAVDNIADFAQAKAGNINVKSKGGERPLDKEKEQLFAKYGLSPEQVEFDWESMSVEEFETALKNAGVLDDDAIDEETSEGDTSEDSETAGSEETTDTGNNTEEDSSESGEEVADTEDATEEAAADAGSSSDADDSSEADSSSEADDSGAADDSSGADDSSEETFSLTSSQLTEELRVALCAETVHTEWGDEPRYWYMDHDPEAAEVYCYDASEGFNLYGFTYVMNGDHAVVDMGSRKRKKISVVDFDEGDGGMAPQFAMAIGEVFSQRKETELTAKYEAEKATLQEQYSTASTTIQQLNQEVTELREFKQQQLANERADAEAAVFAMFADLEGVEAFEALREDCAGFSLEELEEKCYAIRGRNATQTFSVNTSKAPRLPVEQKPLADEPYGGLFVKYPPRN